MKAAIFRGAGRPLSIETVADPSPAEGEAVIRVRYCGVCGTDLHLTEEHTAAAANGTILGHEFAGEIVALGSGDCGAWTPGDRLCTMPFIGCGRCLRCLEGRPWLCAARQIVGIGVPGGFAEYARVHLTEAIHLPDAVSWQEGALVEPLAVALHGIRRLRYGVAGKSVLVVGAGPIGLSAALWCRFFGAQRVVVSEPNASRRARAMRMGATESIATATNAGEAFRDISGTLPDLVVECVGLPGIIDACFAHARHRAEVLVLGYCVKPDTFLPNLAVEKELSVQFSIAHERTDFQFVVDMITAGRIDVSHMITNIAGFDAFPDAFEALRKPSDQCKLLLDTFG